ncbi:MAG: deoxyuridine 5'-triphosphate nucleotidohydrolase [Desulfurococcaceae archaeon]
MCILSPEDIAKVLGVPEHKLDCSGIKLTLAEVYALGSRGELHRDRREVPIYNQILPEKDSFHLNPGSYVIRYAEEVSIPSNCIGLAIPRSSLIRMGAFIATAVWDPGYYGRGVGLLTVYNPHGVSISIGTQVAQLVLIKMCSETTRTYRGIYQGEGL